MWMTWPILRFELVQGDEGKGIARGCAHYGELHGGSHSESQDESSSALHTYPCSSFARKRDASGNGGRTPKHPPILISLSNVPIPLQPVLWGHWESAFRGGDSWGEFQGESLVPRRGAPRCRSMLGWERGWGGGLMVPRPDSNVDDHPFLGQMRMMGDVAPSARPVNGPENDSLR